jgi:hypothetical protein
MSSSNSTTWCITHSPAGAITTRKLVGGVPLDLTTRTTTIAAAIATPAICAAGPSIAIASQQVTRSTGSATAPHTHAATSAGDCLTVKAATTTTCKQTQVHT